MSEDISALESLSLPSTEPWQAPNDRSPNVYVGKQRAPRSCELCHQRKVKCDKKDPCTPCDRANKLCVYPRPGPRIRRTKRSVQSEMATRIADLENILSQAVYTKSTDQQSPSAGTNKAQSNPDLTRVVPSSIETDLAHRCDTGISTPSSADILVQKGSTSHYFNEIVLSRVLNENEHVQTALTSPQAGVPTQHLSPYNLLGILSAPDLSRPPHTFHPPSRIASQLWATYLNNLEIFAGQKLLHIPTDEVKVFQTIRDPSSASLEDLSLCFAIYFGSVLSLRDADQYAILGERRVEALLDFKTGLEQALARANLLDRPTFTGCQALAVYLVR